MRTPVSSPRPSRSPRTSPPSPRHHSRNGSNRSTLILIFRVAAMVGAAVWVTATFFLARQNNFKEREDRILAEINLLKRRADLLRSKGTSTDPVLPIPTLQQPPSVSHKRVEFIRQANLNYYDRFSASWWQNKERFIQLDVEKHVTNVECDALKPVEEAGRGIEDLRMTRDWLDFSVEHLSKWWKMSERPIIYAYAIGKLEAYVERTLQKSMGSAMQSSIALIPYGVADKLDEPTKQMWVISLAATISSLLQHGIGRVVIVGHYETDAILTRKVFRYLLHHSRTDNYMISDRMDDSIGNAPFSTRFGPTELAYVYTNDVKSKFVSTNVPKGALSGLQRALKGDSNAQAWLGSKMEKYKYVYFTESDQILNARLGPTMKEALDERRIIVPHRLQPIPHPLDLDYGILRDPNLIANLTETTERVISVHSDTDACCDTGEHPASRRL